MSIIVLCVGIVGGVILALYFTSKRPINVNVDARAEAHGGSAYTSAGTSDTGGGIIGGIANLIKVAALAAVAVLALVTIGNLLTQRSAAERPIVINVPPQQAPIVNVPQAEPPVINVQPQAPIVNVPVSTSPLETIGLIVGALASVITIIVSFKIIRLLNNRQPATQYQYPIEYERTSYGWTPKKQEPIAADDIAPGLFNQKADRGRHG